MTLDFHVPVYYSLFIKASILGGGDGMTERIEEISSNWKLTILGDLAFSDRFWPIAGMFENRCPIECGQSIIPRAPFLQKYSSSSLLGLLAKIKCSICSYQFNIWYGVHSTPHILIVFVTLGYGIEVYLTPTTSCLGVALQLRAAHFTEIKYPYNSLTLYDGSGSCQTHRGQRVAISANHRQQKIQPSQPGPISGKSILTWRGSKPDHQGASSRARLLHCTTLGLTPAITPNASNSTVQFLVAGTCVRASPLQI